MREGNRWMNKQKLIEQIKSRIAEQPRDRVNLGGYHTGQLQAYQNVIDDIQSGAFDDIEKSKEE